MSSNPQLVHQDGLMPLIPSKEMELNPRIQSSLINNSSISSSQNRHIYKFGSKYAPEKKLMRTEEPIKDSLGQNNLSRGSKKRISQRSQSQINATKVMHEVQLLAKSGLASDAYELLMESIGTEESKALEYSSLLVEFNLVILYYGRTRNVKH